MICLFENAMQAMFDRLHMVAYGLIVATFVMVAAYYIVSGIGIGGA